MKEAEIIAAVERKHGRPLHVDPAQKATLPAMLTAVGLASLTTMGIGFIPWWGIILGAALVWGALYFHHLSTNRTMRAEVQQMIEHHKSVRR